MKQQIYKIIPITYEKTINSIKKILENSEEDSLGPSTSQTLSNPLKGFEYNVKGKILFDKKRLKDYLFIQIQMKGIDNKESFVNFDYFRDFNRIENISGRFEGRAADKSHRFLDRLESIAQQIGITELRTNSNAYDFWDKTDWFKFSDGTYRKHLRPSLN